MYKKKRRVLFALCCLVFFSAAGWPAYAGAAGDSFEVALLLSPTGPDLPQPQQSDEMPATPQPLKRYRSPVNPLPPPQQTVPAPAPVVPAPQAPVPTPPAAQTVPPSVQPQTPVVQPPPTAQQQPTPPGLPVSQPPATPAPQAPAPVVQQPALPPVPRPAPVAPDVVKRGDVSFNFDDADVYSVIQTIFGDVLRVNYIVDPSVKGRVTFRSVAPVTREEVMPLMEVILRLNGIGIVEEGGLYRIVPIADISKEPAPVNLGRDPEKVQITGKALVQVVPVRYIQSSEMVRVLTPFLSKNAVIIDVPKSNYIIISDTDANVKRLLQLVDVFDSEKLKQVTPQVFVYAVQNSKAKDVAALLQQIFLGAKAQTAARPASTPAKPAVAGQSPLTPQPQQPQVSMGQAAGGEALISESTRIIPDEITNSVIILATPEDYGLIYKTVQKIDIAPRQVIIEGLIVQVTLTDNLSFGLSYAMSTDVRATGIKPFKKDLNLTGPASVNASGLDQKNIPGSGFTFIGTDPSGNIRAVLKALEDRSKAKVVAAPHILVADNREARIQVGQQIPLATSTSSQPVAATTTGGTTTTAIPVVATSTIQYKDIGIILKVKPQVNDSGLISLELSQEISAIGDAVVVGGLDEVSINKTEATSNLVARDGETIIIGGLIREDTTKASSGIPLLSRIPIFGALFGNTSDKVTRNELIILLTPHVVRNQQEAKDVTSEYVDRYKRGAKDQQIDDFIRERSQKKQGSDNGGEQKEP
ncbi:MAG: hypothetical protein M0Z79_12560 [Nitrospiraceae bacterium]|nr:hypothetical protein [Nitrospiraceae bacterium]